MCAWLLVGNTKILENSLAERLDKIVIFCMVTFMPYRKTKKNFY